MEFQKERVFTALNADELKVGSQVFVANSLEMLKRYVTESEITYRLDNIQDEDNPYRFMISNDSCYNLAYLVSEPEVFYIHLQGEHYYTDTNDMPDYIFTGTEKECCEYIERNKKKLKWTDLKLGDVIRHKVSGIEYLIIGLDKKDTGYHVYFANTWASDSNLENYEKVEG